MYKIAKISTYKNIPNEVLKMGLNMFICLKFIKLYLLCTIYFVNTNWMDQ